MLKGFLFTLLFLDNQLSTQKSQLCQRVMLNNLRVLRPVFLRLGSRTVGEGFYESDVMVDLEKRLPTVRKVVNLLASSVQQLTQGYGSPCCTAFKVEGRMLEDTEFQPLRCWQAECCHPSAAGRSMSSSVGVI